MLRKVKLAQNIFLSNIRSLSLPYKLTFILTSRCNCRCKMCLVWQRQYPEEELSLAEIRQFFKNNPYFSWVNLSGGEIFLREDLLDIIRAISEYSPYLYLLDFPTNGILTEQIVSNVKKALAFLKSFLVVTVSIDAHPQIHNQIRNFPDAWKKAIGTYRQLRSIRQKNFKVFIGLTLSAFNQDHIEETYYTFKKAIPGFSYKEIHLNIAHISEHYYRNPNMPLFDKKKVIEIIRDFKKRKGIPLSKEAILERLYQNNIQRYLTENKTPFPCQALQASCFIDPYGNVYPCSNFGKRIGELRSNSYKLKPIWDSAFSQDLRKKIRNRECPQCWTPCEAYQTILGNLFKI